VLRVVYPHELREDLAVVVDPPRCTVRHPEMIFHVDEGHKTVVVSSTVDRSEINVARLIHWHRSFTFEPRSARLHSSPSFYQSELTTRTVVTDIFEV